MKLQQIIQTKNIGKAMMAGLAALTLTSCQPNLSPEETSSLMASYKADYTQAFTNASNLITHYKNVKYLSREDQIKTYNELSRMNRDIQGYEELSKNSLEEGTRLTFSPEQKEWFELLYKNVKGYDRNPPSIQIELSKKYPGFKADAIYSDSESTDDTMMLILITTLSQ